VSGDLAEYIIEEADPSSGRPPPVFSKGVRRHRPQGSGRTMQAVGAVARSTWREFMVGVKLCLFLFVAGMAWTLSVRHFGFVSDMEMLKHLAAGSGCETAKAVGMAPKAHGQAGYWDYLDRDRDGVSCEERTFRS
jgi:hypothetical protein